MFRRTDARRDRCRGSVARGAARGLAFGTAPPSVRGSARTTLLFAAALAIGCVAASIAWWNSRSSNAPDAAPGPSIAVLSARSPDEARGAGIPLPEPPSRSPEDLARAQRLADTKLPGLLTVRVLAWNGRPAASAHVMLFGDGPLVGGIKATTPLRTSTTDAAGGCAIAVDGEEQQLVAEGAGGCSGVWTVAQARAQLDADGVVALALQPMAVARGFVRHADGRPAVALVHPAVEGSASREAGHPRALAPELSDFNGFFFLPLDRASALTLFAIDGDARTDEVRTLVSEISGPDIELTFGEAFDLSGRVADPRGAPFEGASVTWWLQVEQPPDHPSRDVGHRKTPKPADLPHVSSAADGSFHVAVAQPGRYTLVAQGKGCMPSAVVTVVLTKEKPSLEEPVVLTLSDTASIRGRVLCADGTPIPQQEVEAVPAAWRCEARDHEGLDAATLYGKAEALTDEQGRFQLDGLGALGSFRLRTFIVDPRIPLDPDPDDPDWLAKSPGRRFRWVVEPEVPAGAQDVLLVGSAARFDGISITGRVTDALSGNPAQSFRLDPRGQYDEWMSGVDCAKDGRFVVHGLVPGDRYMLEAEGSFEGMQLARGNTGWFTADAAQHELVLALQRTAELEVHVVEPGGAPVPKAIVGVDWQEDASHFASIYSSAEGRALFKPVQPGHYRITADLDGLTVDAVVEVLAGERKVVTLTWKPKS
jgi:protocatechuate 3,4-dioxygenase beta subunit